MTEFLKQLQILPEAAELLRRVDGGGCPAAVSGLQPVQRACMGAAVARGTGRPAVFLCGDGREARQLASDLEVLLGEKAVLLLSREYQLRPIAVASREWERTRLTALHALASGEGRVVVATVERGFLMFTFCSMAIAGGMPSMPSTSGLFILPRNCRA